MAIVGSIPPFGERVDFKAFESERFLVSAPLIQAAVLIAFVRLKHWLRKRFLNHLCLFACGEDQRVLTNERGRGGEFAGQLRSE